MSSEDTNQEELPSILDEEKEGVIPFNKDSAKHEVTKIRLQIAKWVLVGLGFLVFFSLILLYYLPIDDDQKREILANVLSSLFSIVALTIGFIAGSSIDRE